MSLISSLNERHRELVTIHDSIVASNTKLETILKHKNFTTKYVDLFNKNLSEWVDKSCQACFEKAEQEVFGSNGYINYYKQKYHKLLPELTSLDQPFDFNRLYQAVVEEWQPKLNVFPLLVAAKSIRYYFNLHEDDEIELKKGMVCLFAEEEWKWDGFMTKEQADRLTSLAQALITVGTHCNCTPLVNAGENIAEQAEDGREIISRDGYKDAGVSELIWFKSGKIEFRLEQSLAGILADFLVEYEAYTNKF